MDPEKTRLESFNSRVKNNPVVSVLIVFGTIVIALSTFTNAAKNILGVFSQPTSIHFDNQWTTQELASPFNEKDKFKLYFDLETKGGQLFGVIRKSSTAGWYDFKQGIMGGKIKGSTISFYTTERSLFGKETVTYKNLYHGSVSKDEIQFVLQSDRPWGYPPQNFTAKPE